MIFRAKAEYNTSKNIKLKTARVRSTNFNWKLNVSTDCAFFVFFFFSFWWTCFVDVKAIAMCWWNNTPVMFSDFFSSSFSSFGSGSRLDWFMRNDVKSNNISSNLHAKSMKMLTHSRSSNLLDLFGMVGKKKKMMMMLLKKATKQNTTQHHHRIYLINISSCFLSIIFISIFFVFCFCAFHLGAHSKHFILIAFVATAVSSICSI